MLKKKLPIDVVKKDQIKRSCFIKLCFVLFLGKPADIGRQIEGFLFSLSNPFNLAPLILSIQHGNASGRTDPLLGPSFGERELELFEDKNGRIMGYSSLGASFDLRNVSLPSHETRYYLAGSQHFYPNQVEVFYYHGELVLKRYPEISFVVEETSGTL